MPVPIARHHACTEANGICGVDPFPAAERSLSYRLSEGTLVERSSAPAGKVALDRPVPQEAQLPDWHEPGDAREQARQQSGPVLPRAAYQQDGRLAYLPHSPPPPRHPL